MTFASKTDLACDCATLDHAAKNPNSPIEFDARLNEFNVVHGSGLMRMFHCPFCGGKLPESLRGTLFAQIPRQEQDRLFALVTGVITVSDLIARLGKPDTDSPEGVVIEVPERDGQAPTVEARRLLVYSKLSEVAYVQAEVYPEDRVAISLRGKYLGPRDGAG